MEGSETGSGDGPPTIEERLLEAPRLDTNLHEFAVMTGLGYRCKALQKYDRRAQLFIEKAFRARRRRNTSRQNTIEGRLARVFTDATYPSKAPTLREFLAIGETNVAPLGLGIAACLYMNSVVSAYGLPGMRDIASAREHEKFLERGGGYTTTFPELREALSSMTQYLGSGRRL